MDLHGLRSKLWAHRGSVQTLDGGQIVEHSYPELARDVGAALDALRQWGVVAGMRVGIYAQNCYEWLVFDLALIELDAVVVPFTRDFSGAVNEALFDKYRLSLVLISREMAARSHRARRFLPLSMMPIQACAPGAGEYRRAG